MSNLKLTKKYEKYPEYKDSGVEWLGEIPKEWDLKKMRHLGIFTASGIDKKMSDDERLVKMVNYTDVYGNKHLSINKDIELKETTTSISKIKEHSLKKGDILFTPSSETEKDVGVSAVVLEDMLDVVYSYHLIRFRPNQETLDISFSKYLTNNSFVLNQFSSVCTGTTRMVVGRGDFKDIKVISVPIKEQTKIAKYLDKKTFIIDQIIEKKEKQIKLLKEEIVSMAMNEQMNGKGKTIRIGNLFKLADKPISLEDYSEYTALGLYNRGRGLFHKDPQLGKEIKESDFYRVIPGDLIISGQFAWEGAVALADKYESECVVSHRYYLLRDGVVKTEYLLALLMTKFGDHLLNESSRGSAGRNRPLNIKILLKEKIKVPAKDIEEKIESLLIKMGSVRSNMKKSVKFLEEYKSSLISNVVTGKIKI